MLKNLSACKSQKVFKLYFKMSAMRTTQICSTVVSFNSKYLALLKHRAWPPGHFSHNLKTIDMRRNFTFYLQILAVMKKL